MKNSKSYLLLSLSLLFSLSTFAQYTEVINSNRPGVSKSAFAAGINVLQFEVGPYIVNEKHTPLKYEVSGFGVDFAIRYGLLLEQLELNLEGIYQNDTFKDNRSFTSIESDRANFKGLVIGAKYLVYDPYKNSEEEKPNLYSYHANRGFKWKFLIPAVSAYVGVNFDSNNNPYLASTKGGFSPKVMIATQHNFSGGWVFVMNFLKDRIGSDSSDFRYILTLTKSIADQWAVFGEAEGIKSDFYADNLFRFGGAYLWTKDFQLDTAITFNTKDTPSVFNVNLGASYRFDFHQDVLEENGANAEEEAERKSRKKGKKKKNKKKKNKKKDEDFDDDSGN